MGKKETPEFVESYKWDRKLNRYVLVSRVPYEEYLVQKQAWQEKARQTRERRKKIRGIIRENKLFSLELALNYVLSGGESTAVFVENMEKDKAYWEQEIMIARRKEQDGDG